MTLRIIPTGLNVHTKSSERPTPNLASFFLDEKGIWLPDTAARLHPALAFPDDVVSREQCLSLGMLERARVRELGGNYRPSEFIQQVAKKILLKGIGERFVAGMVALVFFEAAMQGTSCLSLYRACKIVGEVRDKLAPKDPNPIKVELLSDKLEVKVMASRMAGGRGDIERRFRNQQMLAPILGSMITDKEPLHLDPGKMDSQARNILEFSAVIENTVSRAFPQYFIDTTGLGQIEGRCSPQLQEQRRNTEVALTIRELLA